LKRTVKFEAFWDALIIEPCDYFSVVSTFNYWDGLSFKTTLWKETPGSQRIEIEGQEFSSPYSDDGCLYFADTGNHRISKRDVSYMIESTLFLDKIGSNGTGDDEFKFPSGIAVDLNDRDFIYVTDRDNYRIERRRKSSLALVWKVNLESGQKPIGITIDRTYVYITIQTADTSKHCIQKRKKSTGSLIWEIGTWGTGNDQFKNPSGITTNRNNAYNDYDDYIYIADTGNHRIQKRLKSNGSYVSQIGTQGAGNDQFESPYGINAYADYLVVADTGNHRIHKRFCTDLSYIAKAGTQGAGNDQFESPKGITILMPWPYYIFVVDTGNHRIVSLDWDLVYISQLGSQGAGNDEFESPIGIGIYI